MFLTQLLILAAFAGAHQPPIPDGVLAGFKNAHIESSSGKKASCVVGDVAVKVTATNTKLLVAEPKNQAEVTEIVVELLQANPTIYAATNGGNNTFTDTFSISSRLCFPADPSLARKAKTIQVLTHGATLEQGYWDIPGLSYVDAAAAAGYVTFSYDRLGVGGSAHPDPIQIVQGPVAVEILHGIVRLLRGGKVSGRLWDSVAGVGHSLGSQITTAVTAKYPRDFDAVVLTGFSANSTYLSEITAVQAGEIANQRADGRFKGLPNGYLVISNPISVQFDLYRYPYFDLKTFEAQYARTETYALGDLFTFVGVGGRPSPDFKGAVDVVLGKEDFVFCGGDCDYPDDLAAAALSALYPNAAPEGSRHALIEKSGHNINAHFVAPVAYKQINAFFKVNGF